MKLLILNRIPAKYDLFEKMDRTYGIGTRLIGS